ncbi:MULTISPECIES: beta-glucosidase [unclassified Caulobacter]|uniref:beta-glucosidase family protein n=1 Tax=unclassified Caulobacter TaxID=2648921 RepID=UPI0006F3F44B|nr:MULTISPECIES: glycoside hydrolase family 3 C-terminal domain-containing protein [unclassified Caulobacter]KQV57337.1 beta-glucosidase [Caulobacter sp. Root342]KQV66909.1 beta-glucosidase [Caulobacter sp. Root343]
MLRHMLLGGATACAALALACQSSAQAPPAERSWMNTKLSPEERARLLDQALTEDERYGLLHGVMPLPFFPGAKIPEDAVPGAGYVAGIPRLGVPPLRETDASLGVANPGGVRKGDTATALPAGLALAASWNPDNAYAGGAVVGEEAARKGFNVLLGGGLNLAAEPRNGRNFEYLGEDPLLAGTLAGAAVRGVQDRHVVSTVKHFALNDQETGRNVVNAVIDEQGLRQGELLAFQFAIEKGQPGSVMCAYNKVNGHYACDNDLLLNKVLKGDWAWPGWVMSDWGAVPGIRAAANGLDQQSGAQLDRQVWFDKPLREAVGKGEVAEARIHDMSRRILRSMFAVGLFDTASRQGQPVDYLAGAKVSRTTAEQGIVLLKNDRGLLPLAKGARKIVVVGGYADTGVLSGGGSAQVITGTGNAAAVPVGGEGPLAAFASQVYHPSSPLKAIKAKLGKETMVRFSDGRYPSEAAALAKDADLAIVFVTQWMMESIDAGDLSLPSGQDGLVAAVAAANPNTIVVLETGGPVLMPWLDQVGAVVEAWYPGVKGGEAIADVLFGDVNPSGRLPITFPASLDQLPNRQVAGFGYLGPSFTDPPEVVAEKTKSFDAPHPQGSDIGYRWYARKGFKPLFPFGHGLSYGRFSYGALKVAGGDTITASFDITNTGDRPGADVPQVYLTARSGAPELRLLGWSRVELRPGETKRVTITADRRLLADFDVKARGWRIDAGTYEVAVGASAAALDAKAAVKVKAAKLKP